MGWFFTQMSDVFSKKGIVSSEKVFNLDEKGVPRGREKIAVKNKRIRTEADRAMNLSRLEFNYDH